MATIMVAGRLGPAFEVSADTPTVSESEAVQLLRYSHDPRVRSLALTVIGLNREIDLVRKGVV